MILLSVLLLLQASSPLTTPAPEGNEHLNYWVRTLATHQLQLVRKNAAQMLGGMGDREAVPALVTALKDPYHGTRVEAARALGVLGDDRALSPLLETAGKDQDTQVRRMASEAVERIKAYQEFQKKKLEKSKEAQSLPAP